MIISLGTENIFDRIQHHVMINVLERSETQGKYLSLIKTIYSNLIANIKLDEDKAVLQKLGTRHNCPLSPFLFSIVLEVLARAM